MACCISERRFAVARCPPTSCHDRSGGQTQRVLLTRVVVAHRPETIAVADRVVAMAGGRSARDSAVGAVPAPIAD